MIDVNLAVVTGGMIGKKDWPAFVPANFSVPANAEVTVHVACFDDADDMSAANLVQYTKVSGTEGNTVTVQPFKSDADPNEMGAAKTLSQLDPKTGVSHTLTFSQLGLNVPVSGHSWTTFKIQTGEPGTYAWECKVPCGSGDNGLGGAMATEGYMQGAMTVVAAGAASTGAAAATAAGSAMTVKAHEAGDTFLFDVDKQMVPAGKTTFNFSNTGTLNHELMVYPVQDLAEMLAKKRAGQDVDEMNYIKGMAGSAEDIEPGKSATFVADLKPGFYELGCHQQGKNPDGTTFLHFDRGQAMTLAVTGPGGPDASVVTPSATMNAQMLPGTGDYASSWLFQADHLVLQGASLTFNITNRMNEEHDFVVYPLENLSPFIAECLKGDGDPNYADLPNAQVVHMNVQPGETAKKAISLNPGWWAASCFMVSALPDGTKFVHRDRGQRVTFLVL